MGINFISERSSVWQSGVSDIRGRYPHDGTSNTVIGVSVTLIIYFE